MMDLQDILQKMKDENRSIMDIIVSDFRSIRVDAWIELVAELNYAMFDVLHESEYNEVMDKYMKLLEDDV